MPIPMQRSEADIGDALAQWIPIVEPDARDVIVRNLSAPLASGFSNETIFADLHWVTKGGARRDESVVVRVKPTGYRVFLESDFDVQRAVMRALHDHGTVPVPLILWSDDDPDVFGAPFFVMRRVEGVPVPDRPPHYEAGWLLAASPPERRVVWESAIGALVSVHRVPLSVVSFVGKPGLGTSGFEQLLEYWRRSFEWAAAGRELRIARAALTWLEGNIPADRATALSWGDSRMGNMLFHQGKVSAVIDWEMVSLGGPLVDLGWWLFFDAYASVSVPRLEGLGSRAETIERWEAGTGVAARDLRWYEIFAAFRFALVLQRMADMTEASPSQPDNKVLRLLAAWLDVAPPQSAAVTRSV